MTTTIALAFFFTGIMIRVIHYVIVYLSAEKPKDHAESEASTQKSVSFLGSLLIFGVAIFPFFPDLFDPFNMNLPFTMKVGGLALMALSGMIIIWIQMLFGKSYNGTPVTRTTQNIFTFGPYKFVRHPMYTATILFIVGLTLAVDNYAIGFLGLVSYYIPVLIIAKKEEKKLIQRYGEEYLAYMEKTGRFIPKV